MIAGGGQAHTHQHISAAPAAPAIGATQSSRAALAEAGCSIADIGLLGIYDSFTVTLALLLEAIGISETGQAPLEISSGRFDAQGPLPLNIHGGLLSYGHCGVAGGMAHLAATTGRMRQRDSAPLALIHADGGVLSAHVSLVLERTA
jgi:acetyl-CoA acetyltransferase